MKAIVAVLLLAPCAMSASAQTIYKCIQPGKAPSFQTSPCPAASKAAKATYYAPPAPVTAQERLTRQMQAEQDSLYLSQLAHGRRASSAQVRYLPPSASACDQARAERAAWERNTGLRRSYDTVSAWNNYVSRACE